MRTTKTMLTIGTSDSGLVGSKTRICKVRGILGARPLKGLSISRYHSSQSLPCTRTHSLSTSFMDPRECHPLQADSLLLRLSRLFCHLRLTTLSSTGTSPVCRPQLTIISSLNHSSHTSTFHINLSTSSSTLLQCLSEVHSSTSSISSNRLDPTSLRRSC